MKMGSSQEIAARIYTTIPLKVLIVVLIVDSSIKTDNLASVSNMLETIFFFHHR